jgi:hypothetical protein
MPHTHARTNTHARTRHTYRAPTRDVGGLEHVDLQAVALGHESAKEVGGGCSASAAADYRDLEVRDKAPRIASVHMHQRREGSGGDSDYGEHSSDLPGPHASSGPVHALVRHFEGHMHMVHTTSVRTICLSTFTSDMRRSHCRSTTCSCA